MQYKAHSIKLSHHIITMFRNILIILLIIFFIHLFCYNIIEGETNLGDTGIAPLSEEELNRARVESYKLSRLQKKQKEKREKEKAAAEAEEKRQQAIRNMKEERKQKQQLRACSIQ